MGASLRSTSWVVALIGLLVTPVIFGAVLGWYGLNPPAEEQYAPVGTDAHFLLNGVPDNRLVVEIAYPAATPPAWSAVSVLWSRMNQTLQKSSIEFQLESYSGSTSQTWSVETLAHQELQLRHSWPTWGTMSFFYQFVPGNFGPNSETLGVAYRASSIAIFPDIIGTAGFGQANAVEATVLVHEFGHELGLVGVIGSAPNEDPAHPGHSNDPNDVMYWAVEDQSSLGGLLGGSGPPTQFSQADLSDLATVRSTFILLEWLPWIVLSALLVAVVTIVFQLVRNRRSRPTQLPP